MLGDTQVLVDGTPAHLFYVSPNQINFQMPSSGAVLQPGQVANVSVAVKTSRATSAAASVVLNSSSPGIFTSSFSGCGSVAALNVKLDGSVSVNSPNNSVSPGEYLTLFETSEGVGINNPPDGSAAPLNPLAGNASRWYVVFDESPFQPGYFRSNQYGPQYDGKSPGLIGVDQVNVFVPLAVREGCAVPIRVGPSQLATVSIRTGGGMCVDPPIQSEGDISIEKITELNLANAAPTNHVIASFTSAPGQKLRLLPDFTETPAYSGPSCPIPNYRMLDAGTLALSSPNLSAGPVSVSFNQSYTSILTTGSVRAGSYAVTSPGNNLIGSISTSVNLLPDIQVLSSFPVGTSIAKAPLIVYWSGGISDEVVRMRVVSHTYFGDFENYVETTGDQGSITMPAVGRTSTIAVSPFSTSVDLILDVEPTLANTPTIPVSGLTLGARVHWRYQYIFRNLRY